MLFKSRQLERCIMKDVSGNPDILKAALRNAPLFVTLNKRG
jgi:hypothetical protein